MSEKKPTFKITITTDNPRNRIYFQENNGQHEGCFISDLPAPLLHLLDALDEGKRVEVVLAVVVDETKVMHAEVVDE